jgi:4-amino-4-deoxy-L-arabinose transferase-like glycosyltransferase
MRAFVGRRSFGFWLAAIVALGVVIRVPYTLWVAPWPPALFNDEAYYSALGNLIALGEGFVRPGELLSAGIAVPTAERAPLYPLTLAALAELGATGSDPQRLLGAITGAGTIIAVGLLGLRLAGPRAGLLAAGLAAAYPTLIAADGALMTESLYGMLAALALLAAYRVVEAPSAGRAALLGGLVGLAALARGEGLFLLPLLLVPLLRRPGGPRAAAVACLSFALVLAPWFARNWSTFDRPVLIATEAGETLAGANCDASYYGPKIGKWEVDCVGVEAGPSPADFNEAAEFNEAGRRGIRYAGNHIGRVPAVLGVRLARTWGIWEPFQVPEGRSRTVTRIGAIAYFLLVPLAIYGFILLRRRGVPVWILSAPLVTVTLTSLVAYGSVRFRHSAELPLVVFAAVALEELGRRAARRRADRSASLGGPIAA